MSEQLSKMDLFIQANEKKLINQRRDFHKYAEPAWLEFRTSAIIAEHVTDLGFKVSIGKAVCKEGSRLGLPDEEVLTKAMEKALRQGAKEEYIQQMVGGFTGVIAELDTGIEGPTIAIRFDIDSNDGDEAMDENHFPFQEGFVSVNEKAMHTCGHDGHAAMGMYLASLLVEMKEEIKGKIRIIFQPAEEGVRGAFSIVANGWLDDVDYFLTGHIGSGVRTGVGELILGMKGYMATTKYDVVFTGRNAHAGGAPQEGNNALLAACTAALNMQSFLQHSGGDSRLNVGVLEGGTGRNVVPATAKMKFETRGRETAINEYVETSALRVLEGASLMYNVTHEVTKAGGSISAASDEVLMELVNESITDLTKTMEITNIRPGVYSSGSEDACYMMDRVQEKGGLATYMGFGTTQSAGNHNSYYDFDERTLSVALKVFSRAIYYLSNKEQMTK